MEKAKDFSAVIKVIKRVARSGNNPSLRNLRLGNPIQSTLHKGNIQTIPQLIAMKKEKVRELLAGHEHPEQDLALIETALVGAGLNFGMSSREFTQYVNS